MSVIDRMQVQIDAWQEPLDRRIIFLSCYQMMTANMLSAIETGEFKDGPWVSGLLHRFADYYFVALDAYNAQQAAPAVWALTFDASSAPQTGVLQNLLLGVNAHINYDLVFVLVEILKPVWPDITRQLSEQRYVDHCHVNDIIAATINSVQDQVLELYSPSLDLIDKGFGPLDEWAISRLITRWRDQVWEHAVALMLCVDEAGYDQRAALVEAQALERANTILGSGGLHGLLHLA